MEAHTIIKLMKHFGIEPRRSGEAVKVQWLHNDDRRRKQSQWLKEQIKKWKEKGWHPRLGKTKENDPSARKQAEKLKIVTSARRPEVREKMTIAQIRRYAQNPLEHPNAKAQPSKYEKALIDFLQGAGFKVVFNYRIGRFWVDIYIPDLALGIECIGNNRLPLAWQRHCAIVAQGIRVIYLLNTFIQRGNFSELYKYISNPQFVGSFPARYSQETMIWGRRIRNPFRDYPQEFSIILRSVNGCYQTILTAPSNYKISNL
jgi:hypothetical protein